MNTTNKFTAVRVKWIDSCTNSGWKQPDTDGLSEIESFGLLVHEDKKQITLSTSKSQYGNFVDQMSIPKCSIKSIKRLKI